MNVLAHVVMTIHLAIFAMKIWIQIGNVIHQNYAIVNINIILPQLTQKTNITA